MSKDGIKGMPDEPRNSRFQLMLSIGILVFAWLVVTGGLFDFGTAFIVSDSIVIDVPRRAYAATELLSGHFPDWTFRLGCGFPLLAEGQTAFLYPPSILYWVYSAPEANDWFVALHMFLLALFLWLFLTRFAGPVPALSGAIAVLAGAYIQTNHMIPGTVATLCWLPLSLWGMDRWCAGYRSSIAWSALATGLAILAWEPHTMAAVFVIQGLFIFYRSFIDPVVASGAPLPTFGSRVWTSLQLGTFGVLVGILLTAFQILPCIDYVIETSRLEGIRSTLTIDQFRAQRLPPYMLATLLHPDFWGTPWAPEQGYFWEEHLTIFLGFVPVVLAPIGVFCARPKKARWFWLAMAILGLDFIMAGPILSMLYFTPIFGWFRWPCHYMAIFALPVAWFTAMGVRQLALWLRRFGINPTLTASVLALASVFGHVRTVAAFVGPVDLFDSTAPEIIELARSGPNFRLLPVSHPLFGQSMNDPYSFRPTLASAIPDFNLKERIPVAIQCNQLETVAQRETTELLRLHHENSLRVMAVSHLSSPIPLEGWAEEAVKHYMLFWVPAAEKLEPVACTGCYLFRYQDSLPRVRMVYSVHVEPDRTRRLEWIGSDRFDPSTTAVSEVPIELGSASTSTTASLHYEDVNDSTLSIQVTTDSRGLLVISDTYSSHVVAFVDGQRTKVERVNHAFRGVVIPPGEHSVVLTYENRWINAGLMIAVIGMLLVGRIYVSGLGSIGHEPTLG